MDVILAEPFLYFPIGVNAAESEQVKECLQMLRGHGLQLPVSEWLFVSLTLKNAGLSLKEIKRYIELY